MQFIVENESKLIDVVLEILKKYPSRRVLFLNGELGSGKTTFTNVFIKTLGSIEDAQSPTFVLHREYSSSDKTITVHHIDLYRVDNNLELAELKLEKLRFSNNYVLIEWANKFEDILEDIFLKKNILDLEFSYSDNPTNRIVEVNPLNDEDSSN